MENIKEYGANWQFPVKPKQKISIAIDGQVIKDFVVDNYATVQVKWWMQITKQ